MILKYQNYKVLYFLDNTYFEFEKELLPQERPNLVIFITTTKFDMYQVLNSDGEMLLHLACRDGRLDIIHTLIEVYGCKLNIRDKHGNNPAHSACSASQFYIVAYFCYNHKSICDSTTDKGLTLLHIACQSKSLALIRLITYFSISRIRDRELPKLIEFEDDILVQVFSKKFFVRLDNNFREAFLDNNNTPLHMACRCNNLPAVKLIFTEIKLVLNYDFKQYVPSLIKFACELRHYDIIDYLLTIDSNPILSPIYEAQPPAVHVYYDEGYPYWEKKQSKIQDESILYFLVKRGDHAIFSHLQNIHSFDDKVRNDVSLLHAACISGDLKMVTTVFEYLIKEVPEVQIINARDQLHNTCLHTACQWGSLEIVEHLFEKGFELDVANNRGDSPLHISIRGKKKDIFHFLITHEANLNIKNKDGETPLHIAACDGNDIEYTQILANHDKCNSWNEHDKFGDTPIFNALRTRNKGLIDLFLHNAKCDILAINEIKGETAANTAARFRDFNLLQSFLTTTKAYPINLQNYMGQTLVHFACWKNDLEMIKALGDTKNNYNLSEDINVLDTVNELTPLQFACMKNESKLVTYFLNLPDSYPDVKNKSGETVLHICCRLNFKEMAEICVDKCSRLARNNDFDTPLHVAGYKKHYDLLKWLIEGLPDTCKLDSYANKEGNTILHVLAGRRDTKHIIELLMSSKKCDHNTRNKKGNTALHFAFREGIIENALYLLPLPFDKDFWYNNDGKSPLQLAIDNTHFNFVAKISRQCDLKLLAMCTKAENSEYLKNKNLEVPLLMYLIVYKNTMNRHRTGFEEDYGHFKIDSDYGEGSGDFFDLDNSRYKYEQAVKQQSHSTAPIFTVNDLIELLTNDDKLNHSLFKQIDSDRATILHYIAMCNYEELYMQIFYKAIKFVDINSRNKDYCTPLHYACLYKQEWMIYEIFKQDNGAKSLNWRSKYGTPFFLSQSKRGDSVITQFFAAHGAKVEGTILKSYVRHESNFTPDSSVNIIVLGDSTTGKTTLIDTLRMMLTNSKVKLSSERKPTTGLVMSEYTYYKNAHCYRFYDFGGQVEFEASHSVHLKNLLALNADSLKNPFIFILLIKGTDSLNQNEEQIMRWLNFVRGHVQVKANTIIHLMLVCSHDDKFDDNESRRSKRRALQTLLHKHDTSPLDRHEYPYLLNCTKPDTTGMYQLLTNLEDMFISSESFPQDQILDELKYYINTWFPVLPCQVKTLIEKIISGRKFELTNNHCLIVKGNNSNMIIPEEEKALLSLLKELYIRNDILLLMRSENKLDWWIVGKTAQNVLFSKANSLFSPSNFEDAPNYSLMTYNTGVVPEQKIKEIFTSLDINADVMINYLISLEFCTEISKRTFECITQQQHADKMDCSEGKLYFFPGLIKSDMEKMPYDKKEGNFNVTAWLFENPQSWSLRFIHLVLVHLTYKFTVMKDNMFYVRRIHLWKNGLFFYTQDQVEILVEAENTKQLHIVIRSASSVLLAKYRADILHEIRDVQRDILNWDTDSFKGECILYPPPMSYSELKSCKNIGFSFVREALKEKSSHRSIFLDIEAISLQNLLTFDPCINLDGSELVHLTVNGAIDISGLPKCILEIPELKKYFADKISIEDLGTILNKYSVLHDISEYLIVS